MLMHAVVSSSVSELFCEQFLMKTDMISKKLFEISREQGKFSSNMRQNILKIFLYFLKEYKSRLFIFIEVLVRSVTLIKSP